MRRINLVPQAERRRTQTDVGLLALGACLAVLVIAMGFSYYYFHNSLGDKQDELASVQMQLRQVEGRLTELKEYEALQQTTLEVEAAVQRIYSSRTLLSQILGDLSLVVPESVWFDSVDLAAPAVSLGATKAESKERASSSSEFKVEGTTYSFEDVAKFLVRLSQVTGLTDVRLEMAESETKEDTTTGKEIKRFSVNASVVNTQSPETPLPVSKVEVSTP